jgi:cyclopropane fatty-acyl-phospholipid synthase-like methyltransferase
MPESQQSKIGTDMIASKILNNPNNIVLDVGAGEGKWGKLLKGKVAKIHGIEVWEKYIIKYKLQNFYDELFKVNMKDFVFNAKYNVAILGDVLEHLPRDEAEDFLTKLKENVDRIYLTIPITICIQDGNAIGNPFETHHYQWSDKEIRYELGFELLNVSVNDNGLVAVGCYEWIK